MDSCMKIFSTILTLMGLIFSQTIFSQPVDTKHFNPLSNRYAINLEGGATYPRTDFNDDQISYIGQLSIDYFFPTSNAGIIGLRAYGNYGQLTGKGTYNNISTWPTLHEYFTEIASGGAGITYTVNFSKTFYPYVFAGGGYLFFNPNYKDGSKLPRNSAKEYSKNSWTIITEAGTRFFVSNAISLNLAVNMDYVPMDNLDDVDNNVSNGSDKDIFFTARAGISFYFGEYSDRDNDGVRDIYDQCPDTPPNVTIDEFGCPVDSDKDGVPDYMDECPHTPFNITVNNNGCPVDADEDGVPDYLDLCKDTPLGVKVDSRGCPTDTDDDGIPDYKDLCPNTPVGTEVNKWGCPIEEKVYEPIKKTEFILSGGINFESGKADLLDAAYPELEKIVKVISDYPDTKWKIEGHTDNTGSAKLNKELSIQRAKSVYNFFVSKGVDAKRLSVNGFGPDFPVAENNTETGKALNRRVAIILVSGNNTENSGDVKTGEVKTNEIRKYNSTVERNVGNMIFTDGYLYCFQVSSWRSRLKAESEVKGLQSAGYTSFIVIAELPELDGTWYRVRVGYFNSLEEAKNVKSKM